MIVPVPFVQRWRERRSFYRPAGEVIDPRAFEVAELPFTEAKTFVVTHHYAASMPAAKVSFGLYRGAQLVGVAVYSHPMSDGVFARLPCEREACAELGRLVLLDDVKANGESFFIARTFEQLRREGYRGIVSFSDPLRRTDSDGRVTMVGHVGTIYQATNAVYTGLATPRSLHLLPDGTVFSARSASKVRARERGWRYSAAILEKHGAAPLLDGEDSAAWLRLWGPRLTRTKRHHGNHTYLFGLDRATKKHLPASLPYPKFGLPAGAKVVTSSVEASR